MQSTDRGARTLNAIGQQPRRDHQAFSTRIRHLGITRPTGVEVITQEEVAGVRDGHEVATERDGLKFEHDMAR